MVVCLIEERNWRNWRNIYAFNVCGYLMNIILGYALGQYAYDNRLPVFVVQPNTFRHIGYYSSLGTLMRFCEIFRKFAIAFQKPPPPSPPKKNVNLFHPNFYSGPRDSPPWRYLLEF